jgi:hypothetical protein
MLVWVGACAVAAAAFVYLYVAREQPAYPWDWGRNWRMFQALHNALADGNFLYALDLIASVRVSDYNFVAILFLMPQSFLLGVGRQAYILFLILTFIFPLVFLANRFISRRAPLENDAAAFDPGFAFAVGVLYTPFWPASLRGMIDVAALIPLAMAMDLFLAGRFMAESSARTANIVETWRIRALIRIFQISIGAPARPQQGTPCGYPAAPAHAARTVRGAGSGR